MFQIRAYWLSGSQVSEGKINFVKRFIAARRLESSAPGGIVLSQPTPDAPDHHICIYEIFCCIKLYNSHKQLRLLIEIHRMERCLRNILQLQMFSLLRNIQSQHFN